MRIHRESYDFETRADTRGELEKAVQRIAKTFWGDVAITLEVDIRPLTVQVYRDATPDVVGYEATVHSRRQASGHVNDLMWGDDA